MGLQAPRAENGTYDSMRAVRLEGQEGGAARKAGVQV